MYAVIKSVIDNGSNALSVMLERIDEQWMLGRIDDDERMALTDYARSKAKPEDSMLPVLERIAQLEIRVAALENGEHTTTDKSDEWPEYVQPTGAHDAYNASDRITWNGKRYVCVMDGCVWDPGTYPASWREYDGE